ncbi:MAG TPA: TetR/AcrR family transcriptional regulator [Thermoleophilaceae bacterium]
MPKIVDHDARREELVEATWRVIARTGTVGATMREIAREAGVSTGLLAHYFADKEALLSFSLRLSHRRVYERIHAQTRGVVGLPALRVIMLEALPLDETRLLEAQIEMNFLSLAVGNEALRELQGREFERFWDELHHRVSEAQELGEISTTLDADWITHQLIILVEGISQEAVLYPARVDPEHQVEILEHFFEQVSATSEASTPSRR